MFEIEGKLNRLADRIGAIGLKENPRGADVVRGADPIVQLHRQRELKAFSDPSLLRTPGSSHSAAYDASDPRLKQFIGRYILVCRWIYIESYREGE